MVRAVADPDDVETEFALPVRTDAQGRRLGTATMACLCARGIRRTVGHALRENAPMHALLPGPGFEPDARTREPGTAYYALELQPR